MSNHIDRIFGSAGHQTATGGRKGRAGGPKGRLLTGLFLASALGATVLAVPGPATASSTPPVPATVKPTANTATPIKHVVVIIGENNTFDTVFATYEPTRGQSVLNLRSEGIVTPSGAPGPNYGRAEARTAVNLGSYTVDPRLTGTYPSLPQPSTTSVNPACDNGLKPDAPDSRFPANLPPGPYQITRYVPYLQGHDGATGCVIGAYVGSPLHRFYQMWQQVNVGHNLFTWVQMTAGDSNGIQPPAISQGGVDEGFYNMAEGDAPGFKFMADNYSMSDNYHQAIMGGTGANHIAIGTAAEAVYRDAAGKLAPPPPNQVENPNAYPGSNNAYSNDGYSGGSYTDCSNPAAPGVWSIMSFLHALPHEPFRGGDCIPGAYYLLNNYNPGYLENGQPAPLGPNNYTVPPQTFPTIANSLAAHGISWGYFGQGFANGVADANYCNICDPFAYSSSIMTNPTLRANTELGYNDFESDVARGNLPAVSFLKPSGVDDGHPASSTLAGFETFASKTVNSIIAQPKLFDSTAIFITMDEGGGYYDSGYVQHIDYFGDGTRVPMIVISPWTDPGQIDHTYTDHDSIDKFIEANWHLPPLAPNSRDHLPNPARGPSPYIPANQPAIGDLMTLFDFRHMRTEAPTIPIDPGEPGGQLPNV
jgi:phospholipase C